MDIEWFELLVSLVLVLAGNAATPTDSYTVSEVVDGDTFKTHSGEDVRLIGVDTPEVYGDVTPSEFDAENKSCLDGYADKASSFAKNRLQGEQVNISFHGEGSYGRKLGDVQVDGVSFNRLLVEKGFARVYTEGSYSKEGEWVQLQERAKSNGAGLWQC